MTPRRLFVIHNPTAGRRKTRRLNAVLERLRAAGCAVALHETTRPGDAEAIARDLDTTRADVLVVAGGDGTVNEAVNGLAQAPGPVPALGIIPMGTANVLAHEIGLKVRPDAIAATLIHGRPRRLCLGVANGRHFVLMAGVGLDAQVVAHVSLALKRHAGKAAYVMETLAQLGRYRYPKVRVSIDGVSHEARTAVVCNGRFYGGPFIAAPNASLWQDGFEVCLLARGGGWQALRYGVALALGRLPRLADVTLVRGRVIRIEGDPDAPVQGDGDIIARLPVDITPATACIEMVCPEG